MRLESLDFLKKFLHTPSPSSGEMAAQRLWVDYVKAFADEVETDTYGNAIAVLNPKGSPRLMISGHADELAFIVQYIDDEGFVYFQPVGGHDIALPRGQRVAIHHQGKEVLGVIGSLAIHMQDRDKKADTPAWHDLYIDIGADNKKAAQRLVAIGDLVTYTVGFQQLRDDIWVGRGCDNRVGSFVAAEVLRLCASQKKMSACLIAASTVQEENGLYGASMLGYSVKPDLALVIDVTHATDTPGTNKKRFGDVKLGQGPTLSHGSVNHPTVVQRLDEVGRKKKIKFQHNTDPRWSGTDADEIFRARGGIATATLGIPNRYMHTPCEVVHLGDMEVLADWLGGFVLDLKKGELFKTLV
jgi:putative aminopeptidase FrvX